MIIKGSTIEDAWRNALTACYKEGKDYIVEVGSYAGQIRRQLDSATIEITKAHVRPLAVSLPSPYPPPTSEAAIEDYFTRYLMSTQLAENETYTYGQFIMGQLDMAIEYLNSSNGHTNQACIAVGNQNSIFLSDPPCLRVIDFKDNLKMSVFFRSWDLFCGFPQNMGGLILLKEYIMEHLNYPCVETPVYAYSSGLHIYEQYFDIVEKLVY